MVYTNKISEGFKHNMSIIHLTEGQKHCSRVEHPLLDFTEKMEEGDALDAMHRSFDENESVRKQAKDELIMGHLYCVKNIVGRFLANWTESKRFEDEMVSEGLVAVTSAVQQMTEDDTYEDLVKLIWSRVKYYIEVMLNDLRSSFSPTRRENYNNVEEGKEAIYNYAQTLQEGIDYGGPDIGPEFIDMVDDLEVLSETDKEHFRHLITQCMDTNYDIAEANLTEKDKESIEAVIRILGELS